MVPVIKTPRAGVKPTSWLSGEHWHLQPAVDSIALLSGLHAQRQVCHALHLANTRVRVRLQPYGAFLGVADPACWNDGRIRLREYQQRRDVGVCDGFPRHDSLFATGTAKWLRLRFRIGK